jgi:natural product biosynthesis luciferase-like monooxygenase protein
MNIAELLGSLAARGVKLTIDGGELKAQAPKGVLGAPERALIAGHKEAIARFLVAERSSSMRSDIPPVRRAPVDPDGHPLSSQQLSVWVICQTQHGASAYNLPMAFDIRGPLDAALFARAADALMERQEVLRTRIRVVDGEPRQWTAEAVAGLRLEHASTADAAAAYARECVHPFRLDAEPLCRMQLLRIAADHHVFLLNIHHIICDGASIQLLLQDLLALYRNQCDAHALPPLALHHADYCRWQKETLEPSAAYRECLAYWREQMRETPPVIALPTDRPRPVARSLRGNTIAQEIPASQAAALQHMARQHNVTLYMLMLAIYKVLLSRYAQQDRLVVGTPSSMRDAAELESIAGYFLNTLPIHTQIDPQRSFADYLSALKEVVLAAFEHQHVTFLDIVRLLAVERSTSHDPVFQVFFILQDDFRAGIALPGLDITMRPVRMDTSKLDLTLYVTQRADGALTAAFEYRTDVFEHATIAAMAENFAHLVGEVLESPDSPIGRFGMIAGAQRRRLVETWNATRAAYDAGASIHGLIREAATRHPARTAVVFGSARLTYAELDARAGRLAAFLALQGVMPGAFVGVAMQRSAELVVALLAALKAGAAYVPIDPGYPLDRIDYMLRDSGVRVVVTEQAVLPLVDGEHHRAIAVDGPDVSAAIAACEPIDGIAVASGLAYMIYTSGSTGRPKGVKIAHRNVVNLFCGLNRDVMRGPEPATWLAVTSISFDISVLELFWTLANGDTVVVQPDVPAPHGPLAPGEVSLFYFAAQEAQQDKYALLLQGARFADSAGLSAVWVPERHFHSFGDHFPNPSVAAAAVATITERIKIRSGSVVLPLHDTLRVAEEWSMVDNLSGGRVELSFASGWHPNDFVLAPDRYEDRHRHLREQLDELKAMWRGDAVQRRNGAGRDIMVEVHPRPLQPELTAWVTAAGSPDTFAYAGSIGAGLLTHILGQSREELAGKISIYRTALAAAGFPPERGRVALMLHTFIGDDPAAIEAVVRAPFKRYLRSSLALVKPLADSAGLPLDTHQDEAIELAYRKYSRENGLIGTLDDCTRRAIDLLAIGVDEFACLIDFGIDVQVTLDHLPGIARLKQALRRHAAQQRLIAGRSQDWTTAQLIAAHGVDRLQSTPSYARHLLETREGLDALALLDSLLVGGEALPPDLAAALSGRVNRLQNMYGPTETTVWSSTKQIIDEHVTLGRPMANTQFHVVDRDLRLLPQGVPGELLIGGDGVSAGYHNQDALTAERFVEVEIEPGVPVLLYRTGDLVRWTADGELEYLGRLDFQVKLRGFRIELEEIETCLRSCAGVRDCAVVVSGHADAQQLVAFVVATPSTGSTAGAVPDLGAVNRVLAQRLPGYMLPERLIVLDALPSAPNGKLDRKALMARGSAPDATACRTHREPETPAEHAVATLLADVLQVERVGMDDDFFRLGGNSLSAIRFVQRFNDRFGVALSLSAFWQQPTVAALAAMIGTEAEAAALLERLRAQHVDVTLTPAGALRVEGDQAIVTAGLLEQIRQAKPALQRLLGGAQAAGAMLPLSPAPSGEDIPATPAQQTLWFLTHLGERFRAAGHNGMVLRLHGELRTDALRGAVEAVVASHAALRAGFHVRASSRLVMRTEAVVRLPWTERDLTAMDATARAAALHDILRDEISRAYDHASPPLMRACLVRESATSHVLVIGVHHLVADGISRDLIVEETLARYAASTDPAASPPPPSLHFTDYAFSIREWIENGLLEGDVAYWGDTLGALPPLAPFPTDATPPSGTAGTLQQIDLDLHDADLGRLRAFAGAHGCSVYSALMTAFHLALHVRSGRRHQVVSANLSNRHHPALERTVGNYADSFHIVSAIEAEQTLLDVLRAIGAKIVEANEHARVPSALIDRRFRPAGIEDGLMVFHYLETARAPASAAGLRVESLRPVGAPGSTMTHLELNIGHDGDSIGGWLGFNDACFHVETARAIASLFHSALAALLDAPDTVVAALADAAHPRERALAQDTA